VCFPIFDHADDGSRSLATPMVWASGWFAPAQILVPILALAARKIPEKYPHGRLWKKILCSLACGLTSSYARRSQAVASFLLLVEAIISRRSTNIHSDHIWAACFLLRFGRDSKAV
ncbi:Hypothetical predicted protein, partial [Olea europaea subsp. europaea]